MKVAPLLFVGSVSFLLSGCWTVSETEYPDVEVARLPAGRKVSVSFSGFNVNLQQYVPVEGHETMKVSPNDRADGPCVRNNTASNLFYSARNVVSRKLIDRASIGMERKGFDIKAMNPDYVIDLKYEGPLDCGCEDFKCFGLFVCTVFTRDENAETWVGRLRVFDRAAKKKVFEKHYTNEYSVAVWGPIPILSPACHPKIAVSACKSVALTALTDEAIADASKFLAK